MDKETYYSGRYERGGALKDPTCETMARHIGRVVGWYTAGGFEDDCGHWHHSGFNYSWYHLHRID